jgi:hypothetical protein
MALTSEVSEKDMKIDKRKLNCLRRGMPVE